ncbi:MAG TPA: hypothetical protein DIC56_03940 [Rhizobium sp.]|nr:hypothetical protein [Rhizobium sp.]
MTTHATERETACEGTAARFRDRVKSAIVSFFAETARRRRVRRTRIDLAGLTASQLHDIGLSYEQADAEIRRSPLLMIDRLIFPK